MHLFITFHQKILKDTRPCVQCSALSALLRRNAFHLECIAESDYLGWCSECLRSRLKCCKAALRASFRRFCSVESLKQSRNIHTNVDDRSGVKLRGSCSFYHVVLATA